MSSHVSRIVEPRRRVEIVEHEYHFDSLAHPGSGYCFESSPDRKPVAIGSLQAESLAHARREVAAGRMRDVGYRRYTRSYWEPAVMRCDCGARVSLDDPLSNECGRCRRWYNGSAQALRDPRDWEPEDAYAVFGPQNAREDY